MFTNVWYVAARSDDLQEKPLQVRMLGCDFVLYREPGAKIDAYPTEERNGFIWAFLGDEPERAAPIIDMPEYYDDSFRSTTHSEAWAEALADGRYRAIPSPVRKTDPEGRVHEAVPRFANGTTFAAASR